MSEDHKIGAGHAEAMFRAGFKELAQILPAFPASSVHPVEEPGLINNLTQQEVVQSKGTYEAMLDQYASQAPSSEQEQNKGMER